MGWLDAFKRKKEPEEPVVSKSRRELPETVKKEKISDDFKEILSEFSTFIKNLRKKFTGDKSDMVTDLYTEMNNDLTPFENDMGRHIKLEYKSTPNEDLVMSLKASKNLESIQKKLKQMRNIDTPQSRDYYTKRSQKLNVLLAKLRKFSKAEEKKVKKAV